MNIPIPDIPFDTELEKLPLDVVIDLRDSLEKLFLEVPIRYHNSLENKCRKLSMEVERRKL